MKKTIFLSLIISVLFLSSNIYAANIYVDKTLASNITDGKYSTTNRNNSGSDGNAYTTVQAALNGMNPGDHIYLREGTYREGYITIPVSKNGTAWTEGNYNKLCSYPGEWAVLDGQNNCGSRGNVLGYYSCGSSDSSDLKYWWFERIEIKNGSSPDRQYAGGFCGNGGPFKFKYCYIHENLSTSSSHNPGGLKGWQIRDSVIEYCYFKNNGVDFETTCSNPAHILIYSDYNWHNIAKNGFDSNNLPYIARNEIRYNYFEGGCVGFKHKGGQLYSGRNPAGGHGWDNTYNTYGDKIHHNIFKGQTVYSIGAHQDFAQVYNNIVDSSQDCIKITYEPAFQKYKVLVYNNTIIKPARTGVVRYAKDYFAQDGIVEPKEHYGWDYNNVFDGSCSYHGWCQTHTLSVAPSGGGCGCDNYDLSHYYCTDNYFYRSMETDVIRLQDVSYTASEFENQQLTAGPKNAYTNSYKSEDPLYKGTTGADKYKTRVNHVLEGSTTIANGGIGGPHPYLAGVTIPSYVGATDPNDDGWVDGVLGLNVSYMTNATGDPDWIEGGGGPGDNDSPYTSGHSPAKGSSGFYRTSDIIVHIQDSDDGVKESSIVMTVNGVTVNPTITEIADGYALKYEHDPFERGDIVVTLRAEDLHAPAKVLEEAYTFTVAELKIGSN